MNTLAPPDRVRLAKLLGLLGSDQLGERAAAALAADRLVRGRGLVWADVIGAASSQPGRPPERNAAVSVCLANREALTSWELRFVISLQGSLRLTPAQAAKLAEIAAQFRFG